jgi:hypothetical protein
MSINTSENLTPQPISWENTFYTLLKEARDDVIDVLNYNAEKWTRGQKKVEEYQTDLLNKIDEAISKYEAWKGIQ